MGGGRAGDFGRTAGSKDDKWLDDLSNFLAIASLVPGLDTVTDLLSIPVDLARGDYLSAGLDLLGAIPVVGEVADTAKIVKVADNAIDAAKAGKKVKNFADFPKKIHSGRQGKHIVGHNNYTQGRSIFNGSENDAQKLIKKFSGKGEKKSANKELVDFGREIGIYVDSKNNIVKKTTKGIIHYSKDGAHIVPARP